MVLLVMLHSGTADFCMSIHPEETLVLKGFKLQSVHNAELALGPTFQADTDIESGAKFSLQNAISIDATPY